MDTSSSKSKSVGFDIGVTLSASGLSPSASLNLGKGNSSGRDVTNVEAVLSAGGTARVVAGFGGRSGENASAGGALTLEGAQLSGNRVEVQAGSLAITSQQDTSVFTSKQTNVGVAVSADFGSKAAQPVQGTGENRTGSKGETAAGAGDGKGRSFGGAGASLSFGSTRQSGDFASVQEQSGISAGSGGFDIRVAGSTTLTGGVIASTAEAANNQLTTGTLAATDLQNHETFKASSINLSASISGIGKPKPAEGTTAGTNAGSNSTEQVPADGKGQPSQGGNRTGTTAGLRTGIGTLAAGAPSVASASGSQSSTTVSAIAAGGITVTSGDTASLGVAQSISRDTSAASADAAALLRQPADSALTKQFTEAKRADIAEGFAAAQALTQQVSVFFNNRGKDEADLRKQADAAKARGDTAEETRLRNQADDLRKNFGAGSIARIGATALTGAAGSNVTGGLGSLVQGAAVNVLQSLAVTKVKELADSIQGDPATRESVRAALQAVVGCAGASAGGSGGCGSAAIGAAASVVINNLISAADPRPVDRDGDGTIDPLSVEEVEARRNLVGTLVAAIATGVGLDANAATNAAIIETENNAGLIVGGRLVQPAGGRTVSDAEFPAAYRAYLNSLRTSPNLAERQLYQQIVGQFGGDVNRATEYRSLDQSVVNTLGQAEAIRLVNAGADARGVANFASQRGGITPADIALFGGDAGQLNIALQYGYTLEEIRASNGRIPAAFAGIDPDAANRAPGEYGFHKPGLSAQGRALVTTRLFLSDTSNFLSANLGEGSSFNTNLSWLYRGTIGPGTLTDTLIFQPINTGIIRPVNTIVYGGLDLISQTPLGDPGVIATIQTSGIPIGAATGSGLQGLQRFTAFSRAVRLGTPAAGAADDIVVNLRPAGTAADDAGIVVNEQLAGSIRNVNPGFPTLGRTQNCLNCAIATDATLAGRPTVALPSQGPVSLRVLERQFGGQFGSPATPTAIEQSLLNSGNGARGIVFGSRGPGQVGHVFNVVNQNGVIRFLDGQTGRPAVLTGYESFQLLRTNR